MYHDNSPEGYVHKDTLAYEAPLVLQGELSDEEKYERERAASELAAEAHHSIMSHPPVPRDGNGVPIPEADPVAAEADEAETADDAEADASADDAATEGEDLADADPAAEDAAPDAAAGSFAWCLLLFGRTAPPGFAEIGRAHV